MAYDTAAAISPAAPAGFGFTAGRLTHQSYAAAAANGPTVAVNVAAATISSVVAASVASPSSATMKNLARNGKLSAAVAPPAAMAGLTGDACLPSSDQDLHTTTTQKSPEIYHFVPFLLFEMIYTNLLFLYTFYIFSAKLTVQMYIM